MNSSMKNILSVLFLKVTLIISVFLFTGYNHTVSSIPQESIKTELVISERFGSADDFYAFNISCEPLLPRLCFNYDNALINSNELYTGYSNLIVKNHSITYLDIKTTISDIQFSFQSSSSYSSEDDLV